MRNILRAGDRVGLASQQMAKYEIIATEQKFRAVVAQFSVTVDRRNANYAGDSFHAVFTISPR